MKKLGLLITMMVGAFLLLTTNVMAQDVTATATATAEIVAPLTITNTSNMNFGYVSAGATGGTVVLSPGESQVVKIQLTKTNELVTGREYRSHLYFRAVPKINPWGKKKFKETLLQSL